MKRIARKIFIIIALFTTTMAFGSASVSAHTRDVDYTASTVTITTQNDCPRTYHAYPTEEEADANPITIKVNNKHDLPIDVVICPREGVSKKYHFDSYGTQKVYDVSIALFGDVRYAYATVNIEPHTDVSENSSSKEDEITVQEKDVDDKLNQLLDELDLGFYDDKTTPYGEELKAFLVGEWDGEMREDTVDDQYAGYITSREVRNRKYIWNGTNICTGEDATKEVNLDYLGSLEVIPGPTKDQQFSFAVDRDNKTFEQWCLLDRIDSWKLPRKAGTVTDIYIIGQNSGEPHECQALVFTLGKNDASHIYSLLPSGIVKKLT